jgi:type I restriction enzyme S subunit
MEVRPGYKQTEVGVIPEDWGVEVLGKSCDIVTKGTTPTSIGRTFTRSGVAFLKAESISESGHTIPGKVAYIDATTHTLMKRSQLKGNDVLISIAGVLGRVGLVEESDLPANTNQALAIVRLGRKSQFARVFLFYALRSPCVSRQIRDINVQAAQANISLQNVKDFLLPTPPTPEQRAIASALSDEDALLGGLERLIAKKRDLKQAVMQQLLTGQTRLPGFHGEWEVKRLGDHVTFLRNGVNSRAELTLDDPVRYLHYGDIHACTKGLLDPSGLPSLPRDKAQRLDRLRDGDLIFADASEDLTGVSKSVEICGVGGTELVSGLHTIAARFDKNVLADGFKAYLQFCRAFAGQLRRLAAGTKVYATNRAHIASIEMRLPGVEEQSAIASIFSDMDAELVALEARRDKTRDLKQAIMQELLTGKTRLIPAGVAHA